MPVRTLEELFDDPHLKATGFFTEREHPTEGPITTFASPLDFEKTKVEFRRHAPRIGEDGVEVLREAGLSDAEIDKLKADKALIVPRGSDGPVTYIVTAIDGAYIPGATSGPYPARPGNRVAPAGRWAGDRPRIGEAIDAARHSVWLTVAFYSDDFLFPDGRGPLFDVLDRAVARGVDVRLLIWRPNPETAPSPRMFGGSAEQRALLARRGSRFKIRWDRAATVFCQHQKSWVIDAGRPSETAFVGGLNLTVVAMERHDVYVEVTGPSATDVHHNFAQRWNEASERACARRQLGLRRHRRAAAAERAIPIRAARAPCRSSACSMPVAIPRIASSGRSSNSTNARSMPRAARSTSRTRPSRFRRSPRRLLAALERGVEVVLLVPPIPEDYVYEARHDPQQAALFGGLEALGRHENFTLAGIAEHHAGGASRGLRPCQDDDGRRRLGDGRLVQSAPLFAGREFRDERLDLGCRGRARPCAARLFAQHLGVDTARWTTARRSGCSRTSPAATALKMERREPDWQGLAFRLVAGDLRQKIGRNARSDVS